jgi:hypothetical protein
VLQTAQRLHTSMNGTTACSSVCIVLMATCACFSDLQGKDKAAILDAPSESIPFHLVSTSIVCFLHTLTKLYDAHCSAFKVVLAELSPFCYHA